MTSPLKATPSVSEASLLIAISFGWFIAVSIEAVMHGFPTSSSFSDTSLAALMFFECLFGALSLLFLQYCGYSIKNILPSPTWLGCVHGALLCVAAMLAWFLLAQVFPQSQHDAQPIAKILANANPSLAYTIAFSILNGLYEETFLLGYLVRGFAAVGASFAIGLSILVRVLCHLYQGPIGAVSILVFGLVLSGYYWRSRSLWPVVFAHILVDIVALA